MLRAALLCYDRALEGRQPLSSLQEMYDDSSYDCTGESKIVIMSIDSYLISDGDSLQRINSLSILVIKLVLRTKVSHR